METKSASRILIVRPERHDYSGAVVSLNFISFLK